MSSIRPGSSSRRRPATARSVPSRVPDHKLAALSEAYGVQRALIVQPNSGYDDGNRRLIDVPARGEGRLRGCQEPGNA